MQGQQQDQVSQWAATGGGFSFHESSQGVTPHNPFLASQPGVNTGVPKQEFGKMHQQAEFRPPRKNETRERLKKIEAMLTYLHDQTVQTIANQEQAAKRENQLLAYAAEITQKQTAILQNYGYLSEVARGYQASSYGYSTHHGQ